MTAENKGSVAAEFEGSGVALEEHAGIVAIHLGTAIDLESAQRLLEDGQRARMHASRIVVDGRFKTFESLEAQRLLSQSKRDLEPGEEAALWVRAEQLADARDYAPAGMSVFADPMDLSAPSWLNKHFEKRRSQIHLIVGSTGAGKSTYSMRLATDLEAHYAAVDDWMARLYGPDRPEDAGFDWFMPRVQRCQQQILEVAQSLHAIGTSSVLELGLSTRAQRKEVLDWAKSEGIDACLHYVDVDVERRWQRVHRRNQDRGTTYRLEVTRPMFDFVEEMFEEPSAEEHSRYLHFRS